MPDSALARALAPMAGDGTVVTVQRATVTVVFPSEAGSADDMALEPYPLPRSAVVPVPEVAPTSDGLSGNVAGHLLHFIIVRHVVVVVCAWWHMLTRHSPALPPSFPELGHRCHWPCAAGRAHVACRGQVQGTGCSAVPAPEPALRQAVHPAEPAAGAHTHSADASLPEAVCLYVHTGASLVVCTAGMVYGVWL